ncbi:heat shock protein Hsp20 [Calothrix sp. NIES-4071]|nr:heat shock protein Hsp20 [Calothrix sp. NIES-4071]BAZ56480.1 heat shock protein Hsp20 [Calothrix sp. NIES-4105]
MMLKRYNPWQELNALQRQMNSLFESYQPTAKAPAVELQETDEALLLKLELPGVEAKDVEIQVAEKAVSISAERKSETKTEADGKVRSEFYYGKFQRVIPLPARIQNTEVKADFKDGILNLTLPKAEAEKNKVVKVNLEQSVA